MNCIKKSLMGLNDKKTLIIEETVFLLLSKMPPNLEEGTYKKSSTRVKNNVSRFNVQ